MSPGPRFGGLERQLREFFFLERAERKSSELTTKQQAAVRAHWEAAARRQSVAKQLRDPTQMSVALSLRRGAALLMTYAFLISRDEAIDIEALTPDAALDRLEATIRGDRSEAPPGFHAARECLVARDPLHFDRLSAEDGRRRARELAATLRWLSTLVEARSSTELKLTRKARQAAAVLCGLALVAYVVVWAASPKDIALGKVAAASSLSQDTTPAGAVDGTKNGRFGFHSAEEDSPWLSIDLGAPFQITSIKVFGRGDCCFDQSIPLALEVSDDGIAFRKITQRSEKFSESDPWVIKPGPLVTRFVRLRTERRSYLVVSEVEVYGRAKT